MVTVCYNILLDLLAKRKLTATYLAAKYEISLRTVYRYLDVLSYSGVNFFVSRGRGGGITLADNFKLSSTYFTADEKLKLIEAVKLWRGTSGEDGETLLNKLSILGGDGEAKPMQMEGDTLYIEGGFSGESEKNKNKIVELRRAIVGCKAVLIEYHTREGEVSERKIEPYAFVLKDNVWYVYAYCLLRNSFRMFKVKRITKLLVLTYDFARRPSTEFTPWRLADTAVYQQIELLIKLTASARYEVEEWLGVEAVKPSEDKKWPYIASSTIYYDNSVLPKLLSFGSGISILSPTDLKQKVKAVAQELVDNL